MFNQRSTTWTTRRPPSYGCTRRPATTPMVRAVRPSNSLSLLRFLAPRPSHRPSITA
jgi:hypothetical protein